MAAVTYHDGLVSYLNTAEARRVFTTGILNLENHKKCSEDDMAAARHERGSQLAAVPLRTKTSPAFDGTTKTTKQTERMRRPSLPALDHTTVIQAVPNRLGAQEIPPLETIPANSMGVVLQLQANPNQGALKPRTEKLEKPIPPKPTRITTQPSTNRSQNTLAKPVAIVVKKENYDEKKELAAKLDDPDSRIPEERIKLCHACLQFANEQEWRFNRRNAHEIDEFCAKHRITSKWFIKRVLGWRQTSSKDGGVPGARFMGVPGKPRSDRKKPEASSVRKQPKNKTTISIDPCVNQAHDGLGGGCKRKSTEVDTIRVERKSLDTTRVLEPPQKRPCFRDTTAVNESVMDKSRRLATLANAIASAEAVALDAEQKAEAAREVVERLKADFAALMSDLCASAPTSTTDGTETIEART